MAKQQRGGWWVVGGLIVFSSRFDSIWFAAIRMDWNRSCWYELMLMLSNSIIDLWVWSAVSTHAGSLWAKEMEKCGWLPNRLDSTRFNLTWLDFWWTPQSQDATVLRRECIWRGWWRHAVRRPTFVCCCFFFLVCFCFLHLANCGPTTLQLYSSYRTLTPGDSGQSQRDQAFLLEHFNVKRFIEILLGWWQVHVLPIIVHSRIRTRATHIFRRKLHRPTSAIEKLELETDRISLEILESVEFSKEFCTPGLFFYRTLCVKWFVATTNQIQ